MSETYTNPGAARGAILEGYLTESELATQIGRGVRTLGEMARPGRGAASYPDRERDPLPEIQRHGMARWPRRGGLSHGLGKELEKETAPSGQGAVPRT